MDGTRQTGGGILAFNPGSYWSIAGTGDFDGDLRSDILWRGQGGESTIRLMNGTSQAGGGMLDFNPGDDWQIA